MQLLSPGGEYRRFTVAAVARSGIGSVDASRIYCHRRVAQKLLRKPLQRVDDHLQIARSRARAGAGASVSRRFFSTRPKAGRPARKATCNCFMTLRMSAAITVSLIILLAGFGIFNVLTMSVLSKMKEIAILRSMGYRRGDISAIFLWQGAMIAVAGSLIGCALGALLTWGVSHIPIKVRGLLYANHFLVSWDWRHYSGRRCSPSSPSSSPAMSPPAAPVCCRRS